MSFVYNTSTRPSVVLTNIEDFFYLASDWSVWYFLLIVDNMFVSEGDMSIFAKHYEPVIHEKT